MTSIRSKQKKSVLVVDDDTDALGEITEGLHAHGLTVHSADTGAMALLLAHKHRPEFILMDYWLPGTTGLELVDSIHKYAPATQVIMMSGAENFCNVATTENTGAVAILKKPVCIDRIGQFISINMRCQSEMADALSLLATSSRLIAHQK